MKRRQVRPLLHDSDRRFWVLARCWFGEWRDSLIIVKPDTVIRWHRKGWRAYWRWRSRGSKRSGRKRTTCEIRELIRRMARENPLWGQSRIQAELARPAISVGARTVALFTVQTLWFRSLYVFFVIHHGTRKFVHTRVTAQPNSQWQAQQMLEACGLSPEHPRYLIHDRDSSFGAIFDRRVKSLAISQIRTPVKAPRANAVAERWIRGIRNECLDHRLVFGHQHLQRTIDQYIDYYNQWRPYRSLGQNSPRAQPTQPLRIITGNVTAQSILGALHHVYQWAA